MAKESNVTTADWCLACGHYHVPADWKRKARMCSLAAHDEEACKCTPAKFVARRFKGKFA